MSESNFQFPSAVEMLIRKPFYVPQVLWNSNYHETHELQSPVEAMLETLIANGVAPLDDGSYTIVCNPTVTFGEPANTEYRIGVAKKMVSRGLAKRVDCVRFIKHDAEMQNV